MMHLTELLAWVVVVALCYFDVRMIGPADATCNHTKAGCPRAFKPKVLSIWIVRPLLLAGVTAARLDGYVVGSSDTMPRFCRSARAFTFWCVDGAVVVAVARVVHRPGSAIRRTNHGRTTLYES